MPPTPPPPVVVPPEFLTGWSRAMEGTEARAEEARDAALQAKKAIEDMRAEVKPMVEEHAAWIKARRDAGIKADADKLEAERGVKALVVNIAGSATIRYLIGIAVTSALTAAAMWFGFQPPAPQDAAPIEQEAIP